MKSLILLSILSLCVLSAVEIKTREEFNGIIAKNKEHIQRVLRTLKHSELKKKHRKQSRGLSRRAIKRGEDSLDPEFLKQTNPKAYREALALQKKMRGNNQPRKAVVVKLKVNREQAELIRTLRANPDKVKALKELA